jgi:hypothetical protein
VYFGFIEIDTAVGPAPADKTVNSLANDSKKEKKKKNVLNNLY